MGKAVVTTLPFLMSLIKLNTQAQYCFIEAYLSLDYPADRAADRAADQTENQNFRRMP